MQISFAWSLSVLSAAAAFGAQPEGYRLLKTIEIPGAGGWDYVTVDEAARRVYVSHASRVEVLDADSGEVKGGIAGLKGVHGIAVAPDFGRGFISNGQTDSVTIFDLGTLKTLGEVKTGKSPDAILYDPHTKRVFAFNGHGDSATVIDPAKGEAVGTLELGGAPEFAVADGAGHLYVNLEDKHELLKLDSAGPKVLERWPLAPGQTPTGLALDKRNNRLFVGCRSRHLVVVNAENGKVVATAPIGERVDAAAFDPENGLVMCSNGDGTVTVVHQDGPDKYQVVQTLKTRTGSKTMALDAKTHRLFIPAAEFKPAAAPTAANPQPRPTVVPGSFVVLVYGR